MTRRRAITRISKITAGGADGDGLMIRTRALPKSFRLAVSLFVCSAGVIPTSWSQWEPERHVVAGRVQIAAVTQPLKLAELNLIAIQSDGQKITSVVADWGYYASGGHLVYPRDKNDGILPVSYDSSGGASVSVTPLRLGKAQLTLLFPSQTGRG
jgi:hypothetical protein